MLPFSSPLLVGREAEVRILVTNAVTALPTGTSSCGSRQGPNDHKRLTER
jgi:hypothetical protein